MSAGVGQFCTKPGVVFAAKGGVVDNFLREVEAAARAVPAGLMLTPRIREMFARERGEILGTNGVSVLVAPDLAQGVKDGQTPAGVAVTSLSRFLEAPALSREAFGPFTLVVLAETESELEKAAAALDGQLTATIHGTAEDLRKAAPLLEVLERKAGRVLFNGYPTGVEVSPAMQHGGPYPSTSDPRFTSVGTAAMLRFARPVCYQNCPPELLPEALRNENPRSLLRQVDGRYTRDPIS
jgi:NADP-dependent aldehyde dehydrogenase